MKCCGWKYYLAGLVAVMCWTGCDVGSYRKIPEDRLEYVIDNMNIDLFEPGNIQYQNRNDLLDNLIHVALETSDGREFIQSKLHSGNPQIRVNAATILRKLWYVRDLEHDDSIAPDIIRSLFYSLENGDEDTRLDAAWQIYVWSYGIRKQGYPDDYEPTFDDETKAALRSEIVAAFIKALARGPDPEPVTEGYIYKAENFVISLLPYYANETNDPGDIRAAVMQFLLEGNDRERYSAAFTICELTPDQSDEAVLELIYVIESSENEYNIRRAIETLGTVAQYHPELVPWVMEMITTRSGMPQLLMAGLLGEFNPDPDEVVPELIELLQSDNANTRRAAAAAIKSLGAGGEEALPHLKQMLEDPAIEVRGMVREAIEKIEEELETEISVDDETQ